MTRIVRSSSEGVVLKMQDSLIRQEDKVKEKVDIDDLFSALGVGKFQLCLFCFTGLACSGDAAEVNLLGYLGSLLEDEWHLEGWETASISSIVFAGEFLGGFLWGIMADRCGRKKAFIASTTTTVIFGLLSALSVNFWMLFVCRGMVGIGIAGLLVPFDLMLEMMPSNWRRVFGLYNALFWACGSIYVSVIAMTTVESLGWRWLTALISVPMVIVLLGCYWLPESPRWLIEHGRYAEAEEVIHRMAAFNGTEHKLPKNFQLTRSAQEMPKTATEVKTAIWDDSRSLTCLMLFCWFAFGFSYYGVILFDEKVFPAPENAKFDYQSKFIVACFEVIGIFVSHFIMKCGRGEIVQSFWFGVSGIMLLLLGAEFLPISLTVLCAGIARGAAYSAQAILWIITPEHYPTNVRGTAHGVCFSASRLGCFVTPYWAASGVPIFAITVLYCAINLGASVSSYILPNEKTMENEEKNSDFKQTL